MDTSFLSIDQVIKQLMIIRNDLMEKSDIPWQQLAKSHKFLAMKLCKMQTGRSLKESKDAVNSLVSKG